MMESDEGRRTIDGRAQTAVALELKVDLQISMIGKFQRKRLGLRVFRSNQIVDDLSNAFN